MKFSGLQFDFGKAKIFVNSIDTEKPSISLSVTFEFQPKKVVWVRVIKNYGWNNQEKASIELEVIDSSKIIEEKSEEDYDEDLMEYGGQNNDA